MTLEDTDIRLMLAVADDDTTAFEELMLRFQNRVLSLLRHMIGNRDTAEELTQEVFLRVFRSRKTYQPNAKFTTWLFKITNNVAFNQMRTRHRKPEIQLGNDTANHSSSRSVLSVDEMVQASTGSMPARQLDKLELREQVRLAVESLNERQRLAVLLNRFEGLSYADIATVMSISPQAVKSLLSRAHCQLRDILKGYMAVE
jgi:RNA polymerase sigma-70 factor (ECF subfamily)